MSVYFISGPKRCVSPNYWLYDYLKQDFSELIPLYIRKENVGKLLESKLNLLKVIFIVLFRVKKGDWVVVYDNDTTGLYLGLMAHWFKPWLVIHKINAMANTKGQLYSNFKRPFVRLAYKNIITTVNNENIAKLYSEFLDLPKSHFIPIPDSISDFSSDIKKITDTKDLGYIFMGGATHRDYDLFVKVAKYLPQYRFVAVTFEKYKSIFTNATANVTVLYNLSEKDFYQKIANSSIVFVPLINDMQGGQLVVMQGALLKKPIITTNTMAIHTYLSSLSADFLEIGDLDGSIKSICRLMEDKEFRIFRGLNAYNEISKFTTESIYQQYKDKLFKLK